MKQIKKEDFTPLALWTSDCQGKAQVEAWVQERMYELASLLGIELA